MPDHQNLARSSAELQDAQSKKGAEGQEELQSAKCATRRGASASAGVAAGESYQDVVTRIVGRLDDCRTAMAEAHARAERSNINSEPQTLANDEDEAVQRSAG